MIIDFTRYYASMQDFAVLNGTECSLCKSPHTVTPPANYTQRVSCNQCGWVLELQPDGYHNLRTRSFTNKKFSFWFDHYDNHLLIRDVLDASCLWGIFENKTSIISLRYILELIHSGACREVCWQIRKKEAIRLKKEQALQAEQVLAAPPIIINDMQIALAG